MAILHPLALPHRGTVDLVALESNHIWHEPNLERRGLARARRKGQLDMRTRRLELVAQNKASTATRSVLSYTSVILRVLKLGSMHEADEMLAAAWNELRNR